MYTTVLYNKKGRNTSTLHTLKGTAAIEQGKGGSGWRNHVPKCEGQQGTASARLEAAKVLTAKEVASQPSASQQDRPSSGAPLVGIQTEVNGE